MPGGPDADAGVQFRSAEYQALRSELLSHIESIKGIESETILGLAALGAWLLTHPELEPIVKLATGFIAFGFWFFNLARVSDRKARIARIASYLTALEKGHGDVDAQFDKLSFKAQGWQDFHDQTWRTYRERLPALSKIMNKIFPSNVMVEAYYGYIWPALLIFAILTGVLIALTDRGSSAVAPPKSEPQSSSLVSPPPPKAPAP